MKVKGLDGRQYSIDHTKYPLQKESRSESQHRVGQALRKLYPTEFICEEFPCLGAGKLRLDFYIHRINVAIEVDGAQHDAFNEFFHGTRAKFANSQRSDHSKEEWCEKNNIRIFRIKDEYVKVVDDEFLQKWLQTRIMIHKL